MSTSPFTANDAQSERLLGSPAVQGHHIPRKPVASGPEIHIQSSDTHNNTSKSRVNTRKARQSRSFPQLSGFPWHSFQTWYGFENCCDDNFLRIFRGPDRTPAAMG